MCCGSTLFENHMNACVYCSGVFCGQTLSCTNPDTAWDMKPFVRHVVWTGSGHDGVRNQAEHLVEERCAAANRRSLHGRRGVCGGVFQQARGTRHCWGPIARPCKHPRCCCCNHTVDPKLLCAIGSRIGGSVLTYINTYAAVVAIALCGPKLL